MDSKFGKKSGFSLAEVLLAITIIAVIAALTIPAMQMSMSNRDRTSKLEKVYVVLDNVINLVVLENIKLENVPFGDKTGGNDQFVQLLVPKLNVRKDCGNSTDQKCWVNGTFNGINFNTSSDYYKFNILDNTTIAIQSYANCEHESEFDEQAAITNVCADIYVDINSNEGPNRWGRDMFAFVYTKNNQLQPASLAAKGILGH